MGIDNFIEELGKLEVLVVGDVMIDRYITGNINRISPEAPVPVLNFTKEENRLGGAANVALNLKALGAKVHLLSTVGDDKNGELFIDLLEQNGFSTAGIVKSADRETTVKTRVIAANQHILRVDREITSYLNDKDSSIFLERGESIIQSNKIDVILFQDYNKGVLSQEVINQLSSFAKKQNIKTSVDPKDKNFWSFKDVSLFKPNLSEIKAQLPFDIGYDIKDLDKADAFIRNNLNHDISLITLSEHGVYVSDGKNSVICPTQARSIVDVCGAGDTVISIASLSICKDIDLENIGLLSNLAGGQVCEKVGVVPVNKDQLKTEFNLIKK